MKILVTGSTGFIGSNLCRSLLAQGHQVRAFHRPSSSLKGLESLDVEHCLGDLTQPAGLDEAMRGVEVVFHTAARTNYIQNQGQIYAATVEGTRSVLEAAQHAGVRRVIHTSDASVLGVPEEGAGANTALTLLDEHHTWNYDPGWWRVAYAKYLAELEVQKAVANGLDVVIVNPTTVIGRGDIYRTTSSPVVLAAKGRIPFILEGGFNIVHVDDVVAGHLAALERGRRGERYLLGGQNITHEHFFALVDQAAGTSHARNRLPAWLTRSMAAYARLVKSYWRVPITHEELGLSGRYFYYTTEKSRQELALEEPKSALDAVSDAWSWFKEQPASR